MKIELQGSGPGYGILRIDGSFDEPESVALAIQRNDGHYLGVAQQWQTTPHWHPQFGVQLDGRGLRLDVGPDIVDGVIAVGGIPLRVAVRVDGAEDFGILRIRGELIGAGAAASAAPAGPQHQGAVNALAETDLDMPGAEMDSNIGAQAPRIEPPSHSRFGVWLAILALLLTVSAAVGVGWYLDLLDAWLGAGQTAPVAEFAPAAPPESEPVPASTPAPGPMTEPEPSPEPELSGIALARSILEAHPTSDIVYERAERAERQKDCAAALVLFNEAADTDPGFAAALARRYDPQTFAAGGCIEQPDAPYAVVFFSDAAKAGDVAAQRRLGQLMTERERSGATYEEGIEWLRKAKASGDEEARRVLMKLGE